MCVCDIVLRVNMVSFDSLNIFIMHVFRQSIKLFTWKYEMTLDSGWIALIRTIIMLANQSSEDYSWFFHMNMSEYETMVACSVVYWSTKEKRIIGTILLFIRDASDVIWIHLSMFQCDCVDSPCMVDPHLFLFWWWSKYFIIRRSSSTIN